MKGAAMLELIIVVVLVCMFFLAVVIVQSIWNDITEDDEIFEEHADIKAHTDQAMSLFGFFAIFLFGGSVVAMVIISFMQDSHPIFLAISIIVMIISIPLMALISNATMDTILSDPDWEAVAEEQALGTQMIGNMALWGTLGGIFILVALYAKFGVR